MEIWEWSWKLIDIDTIINLSFISLTMRTLAIPIRMANGIKIVAKHSTAKDLVGVLVIN